MSSNANVTDSPNSSAAHDQDFRITFRSAEEIEKRRANDASQQGSASLGSRSSGCALHITDAQPAFLNSLPTPTQATA
ncbi:hypothetical protein I316_00915 [Kwoniella heveanensis BCC8398]|uniref:Uncharacterized protein n=1 Tax=Kwoniella heveanensis BCC8398 TaxID=1296120 RepID=A0A1B9H163_9TREE|nr:hypothetical protein I316_00915 [Kwoniella heveanensis BCC8398]